MRGQFLEPSRQADNLRCSQTEVTEVLKGSINFNENSIPKIRRSPCQLTGYEEVSGELPAEGKVAADSSTSPPWAVQRDRRPHGVWSW